MTAFALHSFPFLRLARLAGVLALLLCLVPADIRAQSERQLTEKTSTELQKLKALSDAKDWDGCIALLDSIARDVRPDSYDQAVLADIKGKVYLQKGEYAKAIAPMETALRLADTQQFFEERTKQDMVYYLAQIYYAEATSTKVTALQTQYFTKAAAYLNRWLESAKEPTPDGIIFYASVLYNQAVINPDKIDTALLKKAEEQVRRGLVLSVHPKDMLYVLQLAILQQLNDHPRSAEVLELLVKAKPDNKQYWQQLMATYLNMALEQDEKSARESNLRAIVTIERAQALGILNTPKDNYNLVGIYFNIGQFARATELLHADLKNGSIDSEQKNWELLAYSYQQINKELQAISALREASKVFPKVGDLDFRIAQIYYSMDKTNEAYNALKIAVTKESLEKPAAVYAFLGYTCYELQKYEEGLSAIDKAMEFPESQKDTQLPRVRKAIEDAIAEREAAKNKALAS